MNICALTPIVRIFEDFDKMSAKEVYYNDSGDKVIVKLLHCHSDNDMIAASSTTTDISHCSSNDESLSSSSSITSDGKPKRTHRRLSDGRKRSTSNIFHKCSKAFADTHSSPTTATTSSNSTNSSSHRKTSTGSSKTSMPSSMTTSHVSTSDEFTRSKQLNRRYLNPGSLRKHILIRRSPSPSALLNTQQQQNDKSSFDSAISTGYAQYQMSLLEVPLPKDYGDASSDDLSSEWDSDVPAERLTPKVCSIFFS